MFLKDALKKFILKKKSADDNKSVKLTQRTRSYFGLLMCVYLLNKRMPDSKKIYPCVHKSKNKDKEISKLKRKKKRNEMLLDSNPHLYPLGYRGIVILACQQRILSSADSLCKQFEDQQNVKLDLNPNFLTVR